MLKIFFLFPDTYKLLHIRFRYRSLMIVFFPIFILTRPSVLDLFLSATTLFLLYLFHFIVFLFFIVFFSISMAVHLLITKFVKLYKVDFYYLTKTMYYRKMYC